MHELGARRDHIRVKVPLLALLFLRIETNLVLPLGLDFCLSFFLLQGVFGCPKSPGPLLVHLSPWSHPINGQIQTALWAHYAHNFICVLVDVLKYFEFALRLGSVLGVSARVDNSVHVQIQVVHARVVLLNLRHHLLFHLLLMQ